MCFYTLLSFLWAVNCSCTFCFWVPLACSFKVGPPFNGTRVFITWTARWPQTKWNTRKATISGFFHPPSHDMACFKTDRRFFWLLVKKNFYSGPPLLTTEHCSHFFCFNLLALSLPRDASKQKQKAHRVAVALQTFLPCFHTTSIGRLKEYWLTKGGCFNRLKECWLLPCYLAGAKMALF